MLSPYGSIEQNNDEDDSVSGWLLVDDNTTTTTTNTTTNNKDRPTPRRRRKPDIFHDNESNYLSTDLIFSSSSPTIKMIKIFAISCLLVASFQSVSAWMNKNNNPQTALQKAAAIVTISAAIVAAPMTANAVGSVDFTGSYADPNHPNCLREVRVVGGNQADVSGTDGTPGCPADGSGNKWDLMGKVEGDSILVDFTPKGGPKDLKGVWEAAPVPGIRWPDGNLWNVKTPTQ
jgi:hypothetical protein